MATLRRHQLVRLNDAGWRQVHQAPWDDEARSCLDLWASHDWPLVVTRQRGDVASTVSLGLSAPLAWAHRRIALAVDRGHIAGFDEFPRLSDVFVEGPWRNVLCAELDATGTTARVYGSHGWQALTGLPHVHADSDVDLWVAVSGVAQADRVAAVLAAAAPVPRLDGELLFPDGRGFAWREWHAWRSGECRAILAKTLTGATLQNEALPC